MFHSCLAGRDSFETYFENQVFWKFSLAFKYFDKFMDLTSEQAHVTSQFCFGWTFCSHEKRNSVQRERIL